MVLTTSVKAQTDSRLALEVGHGLEALGVEAALDQLALGEADLAGHDHPLARLDHRR